MFILVDVTLKNIDEEAIESSDIASADLFDISEDGYGVGNSPGYSSVNDFEGEIAPGEETTGQLLFDHFDVDLPFPFLANTKVDCRKRKGMRSEKERV